MYRYSLALFFLFTASLPAQEVVPPENQGPRSIEHILSFEGRSLELIKAIQNGNVESAQHLFFPEAAFLTLKAIEKPGDYYKQLTSWYAKDITQEHSRLPKDLTFSRFKLGSCKWKAKGSEANSIPYWSCYNSRIYLKNKEKKEFTLEIRTLINWGKTWYITHLLPIPKS